MISSWKASLVPRGQSVRLSYEHGRWSEQGQGIFSHALTHPLFVPASLSKRDGRRQYPDRQHQRAMGHTNEVHLKSYARFKPNATADLVAVVNVWLNSARLRAMPNKYRATKSHSLKTAVRCIWGDFLVLLSKAHVWIQIDLAELCLFTAILTITPETDLWVIHGRQFLPLCLAYSSGFILLGGRYCLYT